MITAKWVIHWDNYARDTYLYGAKLIFHAKDDVEYQNEMMPAGTVIKTWYSKTNFQLQRIEPTLPIIDGESSYRITSDFECNKGEHCYLRIVYFDKYGIEAGDLIVRDKEAEFQCPLKTYSYKIELINAGASHICFHSFTIEEIA